MNEIFKTNLRAVLDERNMTQEKLARELGVSNRTVQAWCLGQTFPQPRSRADLARVLKLPEDWFLQRHDEKAAA